VSECRGILKFEFCYAPVRFYLISPPGFDLGSGWWEAMTWNGTGKSLSFLNRSKNKRS